MANPTVFELGRVKLVIVKASPTSGLTHTWERGKVEGLEDIFFTAPEGEYVVLRMKNPPDILIPRDMIVEVHLERGEP